MAKFKRKTPQEMKKEVEAITADMDQRIDAYFHSPEQMKEYLSFMGKFHQYSPNNTALIQNQFHGAEAVGSYAFWEKKGFPVQKGEKGMKVLVPNQTNRQFQDENEKWQTIKKATSEQKQKIERGDLPTRGGRLYFSLGSVFDVSQTSAKASDLPHIFPNRWLEGNVENMAALRRGMEDIAKDNGIRIIPPKEELGAAKGASYPMTKEVALNPRNSEKQDVKTLLHELTHAKLHTKERYQTYTPAEREFQAEMTAYTVAKKFGIDTSEYSLNYLHNWTKGREFEDKKQLLKEVHETAHGFIDTMENRLVNEQEAGQEKEQKREVPTFYESLPEEEPKSKGSDHMNENQLEAMRMYAFERVKAVHDPRDLDQDYGKAQLQDQGANQDTYRLPSNVQSRPDFEVVHDKEKNQLTAYRVNERDDSRTRLNRNPVSMFYLEKKHERQGFELQKLQNESVPDQENNKVFMIEYQGLTSTKERTMDMEELRNASSIPNKDKLSDRDFLKAYNAQPENENKSAAILERDIDRPMMLVEWSENDKLRDNTFLPYKEGNALMTEQAEARKGSAGFDKTRHHIVLPKGVASEQTAVLNLDRHDIGDGEFRSSLDQVKQAYRPKEGVEREKAIAALEKEVGSEPSNEKTLSADHYKDAVKASLTQQITPEGEKPLEQENHARESYKETFKANLLNALEGKKPKEKQEPERETETETKTGGTSPFPPISKQQKDEMKAFEASHSYHDVYNLKKEAISEIKEMNLSPRAAENLKKLETQLDKEYKQDRQKDPSIKKGLGFRKKAKQEPEMERA